MVKNRLEQDICADESCALDHVMVAATGKRWHIAPVDDEELARVKSGALELLQNPNGRMWGVDILTLRLVARIERDRESRVFDFSGNVKCDSYLGFGAIPESQWKSR